MKYSELRKMLDELHFEGTNIDPELVVAVRINDQERLTNVRVLGLKRTLNWSTLIFTTEPDNEYGH